VALIQEALGQLASFYATIFPIALYTTWVVLALNDLRQREMAEWRQLLWAAGILFVPVAGPLSYLLLAETAIAWNFRLLITVGASIVYVGATVLLSFLT
jgi:hypothetical protein